MTLKMRMAFRRVFLLAGAAIAFLLGEGTGAFVSGAQPVRDTTYNDTKGEGKALIEELLVRMPPENSQILGLLKIRAPEKETIEIPVRMTTRLTNGGWDEIYETQPVGERPGEVFIVKHHGNKPNDYIVGEYRKLEEKPALKVIKPGELYRHLAGSDFYLADLGLEFLHWPAQKIVKKEMRKSRSCRVVESLNPEPGPGKYSRVLSWIDFETSGIILAEAYDENGKLLKEFSIQSFDRKEKRLREVQIRNDQTDSRTRLELNLVIDQEAKSNSDGR
jgi:hypothetical protein